MKHIWQTMRRDRKYLPETIDADRFEAYDVLERILKDRGVDASIEVMTDQIDVYVKDRKVAVYMIFETPNN